MYTFLCSGGYRGLTFGRFCAIVTRHAEGGKYSRGMRSFTTLNTPYGGERSLGGHPMKTLVVVAMLVVVSTSTAVFAADSALEVPYDLDGHKVEVDSAYNKEHPGQQGLQATVAALRARTAEVRRTTNAAAAGADQALTTSNLALQEARAAKAAAQSDVIPGLFWAVLVLVALLLAALGLSAASWARANRVRIADLKAGQKNLAIHVARIGESVGYKPNPDDPVTDEEMERLALLFAPVAAPDVILLTGPSSPLEDEDRWSGDDVPLDDPEEDDPVTDDSAEDWML